MTPKLLFLFIGNYEAYGSLLSSWFWGIYQFSNFTNQLYQYLVMVAHTLFQLIDFP